MHDELRRLDEDLAAGRLDADSYRRRRDELLAARLTEPRAVEPGGAEPRPVESGDGAATGRAAAVESATDEIGTDEVDAVAEDVRDPFPPPFRWHAAGAANGGRDSEADATQVVTARPGPEAGEAPERTQVVRGAADGAPPPGAADATQVVGRSRVPDPWRAPRRAGPLAPPAAPERTQFVPGAALTRAGDLRSVPARRTVPPWADERSTGPADARRPGREVFARGRGPSPAAVLGTAALVVVVLVVLVFSFLLS